MEFVLKCRIGFAFWFPRIVESCAKIKWKGLLLLISQSLWVLLVHFSFLKIFCYISLDMSVKGLLRTAPIILLQHKLVCVYAPVF
jgi:hypothetical protein